VRRSAVLQGESAGVGRARRCQDGNFEMICLYDVRNVARAMRGNFDSGPASQAVIERFRVTSRANLLAKLLRGVMAALA